MIGPFDFSSPIKIFIRKVLGIDPVHLTRHAQPAVFPRPSGKKPPTIQLPLDRKTFEQYGSMLFTTRATEREILTILRGIACHEAAHLVSGESCVVVELPTGDVWSTQDLTEPIPAGLKVPHNLLNLVHDVNDFTVVPTRWPGAVNFNIARLTLLEWRCGFVPKRTRKDLTLDPSADPPRTQEVIAVEESQRLFQMCLQYMRNLRIPYDVLRYVRTPDADDTLVSYFERCAVHLRTLRKLTTTMVTRDRIAVAITKIFLEHFLKAGGTEDLFYRLYDPQPPVLAGAPGSGSIDLTGTAGSASAGSPDPAGSPSGASTPVPGGGSADPDPDPDADTPVLPEIPDDADDPDPAFRGVGSKKHHLPPDAKSGSYTLDVEIARRTSQLLSERLTARHAIRMSDATLRGKRLSRRRLTDLYTDPEHARLWKSPTAPDRVAEAHVVGVFDRSGSMSGEPERICKSVACTLLAALYFLRKIEISYVRFGSPPDVIFESRPPDLQGTMDSVYRKLKATGENDVPHATHMALDILETSQARRKLVVIVNDGDLGSPRHDMAAELQRARLLGVDLMILDINASYRSNVPGFEQQTFLVQDIQDLPHAVMSTVTAHI